MLHDRRAKIIQMITADRMVKVSDLTELFQVSIETIRRDLEHLEEKGYLDRVYGGAVAKNIYHMEPEYPLRKISNFVEKSAIAEAAGNLLNDGDTIMMDMGTTTLELAKWIKGKKRLTVLTNSLQIALVLSEDPNIRLIMMGGEIRRGDRSTFGFLAEEAADLFHVDKAIIGIDGITGDSLTDYQMEEANLKRHMIKRASYVIGLADSSKFGITTWNHVCELNEIQMIVTDSKVPAKYLEELRYKGVRVLVADNRQIFGQNEERLKRLC